MYEIRRILVLCVIFVGVSSTVRADDIPDYTAHGFGLKSVQNIFHFAFLGKKKAPKPPVVRTLTLEEVKDQEAQERAERREAQNSQGLLENLKVSRNSVFLSFDF